MRVRSCRGKEKTNAKTNQHRINRSSFHDNKFNGDLFFFQNQFFHVAIVFIA